MDRFKITLYKNRLAFTCFFIITLFVGSFLLSNANSLGIEDWDQHYSYAQVARTSLLDYGQIPLWNPYHCGGITQIGNPQTDFLNPHFFFIILFGPVVGYKILFLIYLFIGLAGFYFLGTHFRISTVSSILLASIYMLSGLTVIPFGVGMTNFLNIGILPWVYLFYSKAFKEKKLKFILFASLGLSMIFFGGYHYFVQIIIFLLLFSVVEIVTTKNWGLIWFFIIFLIVFSMLSAVKLFPSIETALAYPRVIVEESSGYSGKSFYMSLLSLNQTFAGFESWKASYGIDENGMYVGLPVLILFLFGIFYKGKNYKRLLILFIFFLVLSFGLNLNPSLYKLIHSLPILDNLRVAQRYRYFFMIPFVLFVGFGFDIFSGFIRKIFKNKPTVCLSIGLTATLLIVNIAWVNLSFFKEAFNIPFIKINPAENFVQRCSLSYYDKYGPNENSSYETSYSDEYIYTVANYGSPSCYEPIPVVGYPKCQNDNDYRGEYYFENDSGKINLLHWSPNRIDFQVNTPKADLLLINQNYEQGWRVKKNNTDAQVKNKNGLIAVEIYPEDKIVSIHYLPASFIKGLLISLISVIILMIFYIKKINDRKFSDSNFKTKLN